MKTVVTILTQTLICSFLIMSFTISTAVAQHVEVKKPDSRITNTIDQMGEKRFKEMIRKSPQFQQSMKLRAGERLGGDLKVQALVNQPTSTKRESNIRAKSINGKWMSTVHFYDVAIGDDGSPGDEDMWERGYFSYAEGAEGNLTTNLLYQELYGDWMPEERYEETINLNSQITSEAYYEDFNNGNWKYIDKYTYAYDAADRLVEMTSYSKEYNQERYLYTYDSDGNLTELLEQEKRGNGVWRNNWRVVYDRNEDGLILVGFEESWDRGNQEWIDEYRWTNTFDEQGNLIEQVTEYYNDFEGVLENGVKYILEYDENNNRTNYTGSYWNFETETWEDPSFQYIYTYSDDGLEIEYIYQYWDDEWIDGNKYIQTFDSDGRYTGYEYYYWDDWDMEWVLSNGSELTFDENGNLTEEEYFYGSGSSDITTYEYDAEGDLVKETISWKNSEGIIEDTYYTEYTYSTEQPVETPLLNISSLQDRPDDQGGFMELEVGGHLVDSEESDAYTGYWLVWSRNGDNWENVHRSEYVSGMGNTATITVPDTKPADEEANSSNSFDYKITAHGSGGGLIAETAVKNGFAVDNIEPEKVQKVVSSIEENSVTFTWDQVQDNDLDGYHIYGYDDGSFDIDASLGFSKSTSIEIDKPSEEGTYEYVIVAMDKNKNMGTASDPVQVQFLTSIEHSGIPQEFKMEQNYPNPFNPSTSIKYEVPEQSHVKITVFNMLGQSVRELVNTSKSAGRYSVNFDATDLTSGMYVYRIEAGNFTQTKKMTLLK